MARETSIAVIRRPRVAILAAALLTWPAAVATSQALPLDPAVMVDSLPNGLRYYIRVNKRPEQRAELRLVVRAGSVLERDDERGLAHFVEHMAFEGSTHFARNELVHYLESVGIRFGADLNAYTSFDETVYMLSLPTDTASIVDHAFTVLADEGEDIVGALEALADELGARATPPARIASLDPPAAPTGSLTLEGIAAVIGALLPEHAIVVDESVSSGRGFSSLTAHAHAHDWLCVTGGSIGFGLPAATGAAIGAPGRKVLCLEGDGSAMYTMQSLWTMAREQLDVTVLVFANRSYRILKGELAAVGAGDPGQRATDMLTLDRPYFDWIAIARGHGVDAGQARTLDELAIQIRRGFSTSAPYLIELLC